MKLNKYSPSGGVGDWRGVWRVGGISGDNNSNIDEESKADPQIEQPSYTPSS